MSSKVEVLCPNGHRVNVKTTGNTKLLQVLEEACNKKGFSPSTDYELRHGNSKRALDLTLTIRFSGLPNNAKLEMVKAAQSRAFSDVLLAIQLETGDRIQKSLSPQTSLWEALKQIESESGNNLTTFPDNCHPVCVYMREEIVGEFALKHTTLQKLGLISGRAVIRLLVKPVDPTILTSVESQINQEKARAERDISKSATPSSSALASDNVTTVSSETQIKTEKAPAQAEDMDTLPADDNTKTRGTPIADNSTTPTCEEEALMDESGPATAQADEDTSAGTPMESEPQSNATNAVKDLSKNDPANTQNGTASSIPGVQIFRPGEIQLTPDQEQIARQLADVIMPGVFPQRSTSEVDRFRQQQQQRKHRQNSNLPQAPVPPRQFMDFKFPEETKGKDLYKNEMSESKPMDYKPCDREVVLYNMDDIKASSVVPVEPDEDFFELTEQDVKRMWSDLQRNAVELSDQPLMTQSMKKAQAETRLAKYDRAFIRFTFPDKMVLQAAFRPRETVYSLYKFVKEYLEDKTSSFYLYTAPPQIVLTEKSQTLIEAGLVPMTVVYFGSEIQCEHHLSTAAMSEISSQTKANTALLAHLPSSSVSQAASTSQGTKRATPQAQVSGSSGTSGEGTKKVPKWFKVGNK